MYKYRGFIELEIEKASNDVALIWKWGKAIKHLTFYELIDLWVTDCERGDCDLHDAGWDCNEWKYYLPRDYSHRHNIHFVDSLTDQYQVEYGDYLYGRFLQMVHEDFDGQSLANSLDIKAVHILDDIIAVQLVCEEPIDFNEVVEAWMKSCMTASHPMYFTYKQVR